MQWSPQRMIKECLDEAYQHFTAHAILHDNAQAAIANVTMEETQLWAADQVQSDRVRSRAGVEGGAGCLKKGEGAKKGGWGAKKKGEMLKEKE